ncbi:MAG: tripartite tricarboxylate transporter substrate binding protein [Betaproteobacteria bacterium]|nr:tripartite tricarboxylate transporter substrate binding protein [Betaproteobacteria bacterium]
MPHSMRRACVLAALYFIASAATAQNYPARPIRLLVPFPAGGGADTLARIFAPKLGDALGQQVIVDNRAGGGGNIALDIVAKAAPDGYTLILPLNSLLTVNPSMYSNLPFNVEKDLQPITQLSSSQHILLLYPGLNVSSVKDLLALAKAKPGTLTYASAGVGSTAHLGGELLKWRGGVDITHVPFKGASPGVIATMSGEVQMTFASVAAALQFMQAGKLKGLAVTSLKRAPTAPELPTLDEAGLKGFNVISWHALLAPAKTPAAIVNKLHGAALGLAKQPVIMEAMARQGMEATTNEPAALAAMIKAETAMWRDVIKAANIRAE